ncbi:MAG: hypothetical protein VYD54_14835 [Bdellovibrionota bacterium]|nr:hypothetical protein [Bdellovibrionota bacterium]
MRIFVFLVFLSMPMAFSMDSFKISAVRKSKPFSCSSAIGDARRKVLDICKKAGKVLNYDTYDIPIVCDWEELAKKGKESQFKATIKVNYECIDKE